MYFFAIVQMGAVLVSTENSEILLNNSTYEGGFFMFLWTKKWKNEIPVHGSICTKKFINIKLKKLSIFASKYTCWCQNRLKHTKSENISIIFMQLGTYDFSTIIKFKLTLDRNRHKTIIDRHFHWYHIMYRFCIRYIAKDTSVLTRSYYPWIANKLDALKSSCKS